MQVKLSTGVWSIHDEPCAGLTCYERVIYLDQEEPRRTKEYLATLLHEALHASNKAGTEAETERISRDLCEVLWAYGYRLRRK